MSNSVIKSFFNYLRGSEIDTDEQQRQTSTRKEPCFSPIRFESVKTFLKYTFRVSSSLLPSCLSPPFFTFLALLVDLIVLEMVIYRVGLISGKYYKCLSNRDLDAFWRLTISAVAYIVVNSALKSIQNFLASLLSIMWRKQLTLKLHNMYFTRMRFYYLQTSNNQASDNQKLNNLIIADNQNDILNCSVDAKLKRLDNPDQRITQDVNSLCKSLASIIPLLIISPFVIGWYGYQAYKTVGISGIGAVVGYFLFWALINGPLTGPIARVVYKQDKKEGDFRFKHVNIRTNAESIAFYDSGNNELQSISKTFTNLLNISYRRNWKELILSIFVNISQYMGGILAYLILAIPIFSGVYADYTAGDLAQLISNYSFQSQYLIYLFTRLYDTLEQMSVVAGNCRRVGELIERMRLLGLNSFGSNKAKNDEASIRRLYNTVEPISTASLSTPATTQTQTELSIDRVPYLTISNVTVRVPDSDRLLIQNLSFELKQGDTILITGPSGCGKTSLFRCIKQLWNSYSGEITCHNKNFFFLPQTSYFTDGSLVDQIVYPSILKPSDLTDLNITGKVIDWLNIFDLSHLLHRVDSDLGKVPSFNWTTVLSAGEKQRLSFLRLLYHQPDYALLDEFTSSVDQNTEQLMYECLKRANCAYISIAHRDTVRKFHAVEIIIKNDCTYEIVDILNIN